MPKYIQENNQLYILYDNCEEYIYIGGTDPGYNNTGLFIDVELNQCCQGQILDSIPLTPTPTITVSPSVTPTPTITVTPSVSHTQTPTPTISATSTVTPSITATVTPTLSNTPTQTPSITTTITQTPTNTPTVSYTPSITPTISNTPSVTPSLSVSPTVSSTLTPTPTLTSSITPTPTNTPTITTTPTITPTVTPTFVPNDIPGVNRLEIVDNNGRPYEIISLDYSVPTSLLHPDNNQILAVCVPLNDYNHDLTSIKPDLSLTTDARNILVSTDTYFDNYTINNSVLAFNNRQWNYINYPTGRISSIHFNRHLNRWFLGCQSTTQEPDVFLYSYDNSSSNRFYIGGNNQNAASYPGFISDPSLNCGPTRIYSKNNLVILCNNYYVYIYVSTNTSADDIDYAWKTLPFSCQNITQAAGCGIDWSDIPSNILKMYEHLPSITSYTDNGTDKLIILYNPPINNSITIDGTTNTCLNNQNKGYYLQSYDFSVNVSAIPSNIFSDGISYLDIKLDFNTNISFNLINDAKLYKGDEIISRSLWDITGTGTSYTISIINHTLLDNVLHNKNPVYTLDIDLSNMSSNTIPPYIKIPLYQADNGFTVKENYFRSIQNTKSDHPTFILSEGNNILEFYVTLDPNCGSGYRYDIYHNNRTPISLCVSDVVNTYSDSEIKAVLLKNNVIYYIIQQHKDPQSPTSSDNGVYEYNIYKANINTPNNLISLVCGLKARREFTKLNRDMYNKWNNTCIIDDNYLIVGIPNSNAIFKISYTNLENSPGYGC